jgi:Photosynthetic reaction centre cytochrome C subunit
MTKRWFAAILGTLAPLVLPAQSTHKFPPDSLENTKVIPHNTPVPQVIGIMRNFSGDLGVRCTYCHVGEEGKPLEAFDFPSDKKRTKLVARQMMLMTAEINRRLDTIPRTGTPVAGARLLATCATCHRGVSRPAPLFTVMTEVATTAGADSALRTYEALHTRYNNRGAYDFGESSLNTAAYRLGQAGKYDEAFAMLKKNEELFPSSSGMSVFRGNITLMRGDTTGAAAAFREAIRRDSTNREARGRLRDIGRQP